MQQSSNKPPLRKPRRMNTLTGWRPLARNWLNPPRRSMRTHKEDLCGSQACPGNRMCTNSLPTPPCRSFVSTNRWQKKGGGFAGGIGMPHLPCVQERQRGSMAHVVAHSPQHHPGRGNGGDTLCCRKTPCCWLRGTPKIHLDEREHRPICQLDQRTKRYRPSIFVQGLHGARLGVPDSQGLLHGRTASKCGGVHGHSQVQCAPYDVWRGTAMQS